MCFFRFAVKLPAASPTPHDVNHFVLTPQGCRDTGGRSQRVVLHCALQIFDDPRAPLTQIDGLNISSLSILISLPSTPESIHGSAVRA